MTPAIRVLDAEAIRRERTALRAVLADAVRDGASVGFMAPVDPAVLDAYWDGIADDVAHGARTCLAAWLDDALVGTVQLAPCGKPNQPHRADVQKLLVHRQARRRGIGAALMQALERHALDLRRVLLTLDTRTGSDADRHYRGWGWSAIGIVPGYAYDPDGALADCTFYFKQLAPVHAHA
jgi:GNAT superfamily N-acetyltransferase